MHNLLVRICRWMKSSALVHVLFKTLHLLLVHIFCLSFAHLLCNLCRRINLYIGWVNHLCRWIRSSAKLIGWSIEMDKMICTCTYIELIYVQMKKIICTYTCLIFHFYADGCDHLHRLNDRQCRWMKSSALIHKLS